MLARSLKLTPNLRRSDVVSSQTCTGNARFPNGIINFPSRSESEFAITKLGSFTRNTHTRFVDQNNRARNCSEHRVIPPRFLCLLLSSQWYSNKRQWDEGKIWYFIVQCFRASCDMLCRVARELDCYTRQCFASSMLYYVLDAIAF